MEPMDLLADTRRCLSDAIRHLEAINAGGPIAKPLTKEQAIEIVTEQIGLFESVLRRYGGGQKYNSTYRIDRRFGSITRSSMEKQRAAPAFISSASRRSRGRDERGERAIEMRCRCRPKRF